MTAVETPRLVRCAGCGSSFELSARNVRAIRARGEEPLCRRCRHPAKPVDEIQAAKYRRWWLERFPLDELREMAEAITQTLD